ncbi:J domain-containing protein [bacterium]|nr:J domain-containing protein [bacterium]
MATRDYYLVLDVPPIAPAEEIRKAYRNLSKKYHPDVYQGDKNVAEDKMKELVEAFNNLSDNNKRKAYDKQPQFQVRKFSKTRKPPDKKAFTEKHKKPQESFLKKLLAPFMKKPEAGAVGPDPRQADVHFTLGLSMSDNESFLDQAKKEFSLSVKFDPKHKEAAYNFALMCYKLGQWDEARVAFQSFLKIGADDAAAKKMVQLLHNSGD